MSQHIVTAPNGQKFKVNAPDDATQEQIIAYAQQQMAPRPPQTAEPVQQDAPTRLERVGRGAQDVIDRLTQLTIAAGEKTGYFQKPVQVKGEAPAQSLGDIATQQMNDERALYDRGRGANAGTDWARIGGNIGMTAPLALVPGGQTWLPRAVSGAVTGGASGALQYDPTNTLAGGAKNTAIGAATGAIISPIAGAITDRLGQGVQWLAGRIKGAMASKEPVKILNEIPEIANLPPQARQDLIAEAQDQIARTGDLNAEQLARKANLIAQGVTPTTSMVTRNPRDWTMERNIQKLAQSPDEQISMTGQKLTDVYQANDRALSTKLQALQKGLPRADQEGHGMVVMRSLDDVSKATQKQVSGLYDKIKQQYGDELASDAGRVVATLKDPDIADNAYAEPILNSVTKRLKRFGMIDENGDLTTNTLTVSKAEEFRKFLQTLKSGDPKTDRIVTSFIKATDEDVLSGAGADVMGGARQVAKSRFDLLDNPATQRALNTFGELQQGKTAQQFIKSQVINAPAQDVQTLIKTLSVGKDRDTSIQALQAGVMQHLESKAINPNSGQFSGAAFNKAVNDLGPKLDIVLGTPKATEIRNLAKAALDATYAPPYSAVNNSNTAPMLLSLTQKARAIPGVPLLVSEEAQKLAARAGYAGQLNNAMAAKATNPLPVAPTSLQDLMRLMGQGAAPISASAVNQLSEQADANKKKRSANRDKN